MPRKCRPMTCLSTAFKLMTAIIAESMLDHLKDKVSYLTSRSAIVESQEVQKFNS